MATLFQIFSSKRGLYLLIIPFIVLVTISRRQGHEHENHGKGPHGGRLLEKDDFQLEITIFEKGVPPQFRIYVYKDEKPLMTDQVQAKITLKRLGGRLDVFELKPSGDYLSIDKEVEEPHSFDVSVDASWKESPYHWEYPSYEGRTEISPEAIKHSEIEIEPSKESILKIRLPVHGRIVPDEDRLVHVSPRFPGIVKDIKKRLGDQVKQGDVLATVESNVNLQRYEIRSLLSGTVVKKDISLGEFVSEKDVIYMIADLNTVWVDLNVYRQDYRNIKVGQELKINAGAGFQESKTQLAYISPFGSETTQSMLARATLANPRGDYLPGLFVTGELLLEEVKVPVAVKADGIQKFRDWDVVFILEGNTFEVLPIEIGRTDGEWVEVLSGMKPGQNYVTKNSFIIKADIMKSGASHDH